MGQPDGDPDFHVDKVCVLTAPDSLREEFLAEVAPMCQIIDRGSMLAVSYTQLRATSSRVAPPPPKPVEVLI